ncbi:MAG TPA: nicotinate phosphoribosyltransferase [Candidatus Faecousia faecavium]|nr:nicotinate phosphoribosyltransferase [Candidatus Faecousia faecavium]
MVVNEKLNLTMLCDFYELTMSQGYFSKGYADRITYFDLFFRRCPDGGGFAIAAGLEQIVQYIQELHFDPEDIHYLRSRKMFTEDFLNFLADFRFTGDIWAVPEGTPVFPKEPIITVRAPAIQAQLVETYLLLCVNHQSLIATKANRVVRAAEGRTVLEFGSRRAQGADAAILGARAAYIGGCHGTACTISDQLFGVKAGGTMAHAWVQMFDSEYKAFKAYVQMYPHNATLLVDTYNTLKSGVPNAIRVFDEVLKPMGITKCGIRLDSGDLAYLTRQARKMLDEAGWTECQISVSNSLDEYIIRDILRQGAQIDLFGVGERLITAKSEPVFGGVYKLVAVEEADGTVVPKIKISENVGKITNPHYKKLYRFYANDTGKAIADYLTVYDETVDDSKDMEIFDPDATWKTKRVYNFTAKELQVPIFKGGELVYRLPSLEEIRTYCRQQVDTLWDEVKRFDNPQTYYVDLSQKLWDVKYGLLKRNGKG